MQLALVTQYGHYERTLEQDRSVDDPSGAVLRLLVGTMLARMHFGEGWSAELTVPMGLVELDSRGAPDGPTHDAMAGASSRIAGFGDLGLGARYDFAGLWGVGAYRPSLVLGLALGFPTAEQASVSPSPEVPPTLLALGAGSWSLAPSLTLTEFLHRRVALTVPVSVRVPLSRAETNRLPGLAFDGALALLYQPVDALILRAGVGYEAVGHADEGNEGLILNSGGSWVRALAGASVRLGEMVTLGAGVRVPFYARVHGRQLAESFTLDATVAVVLGARDDDDDDHGHGHDHEDDDDHDHDHHDHGDAAERGAGDVADLARGGESFATAEAAVIGKVTVVDFWARWCRPCVEVGEVLAALAAEHPDLAIRRAEVIDFDHPIGRDHFGGEGALPHLWILDREGNLVERFTTSSPAEVKTRVLRYLEPSDAEH